MLLVKCFQGKSATCTLHSLPRQVCSDFLASRCSCISDSDFCPVARATTLPVPAEPVLQTPVLTQCAGGRPPTCSGVGSANRKDRQPLGGQVCAVAELCAQPPSGAGGRCAPRGHRGSAAGALSSAPLLPWKRGASSLFLLPGSDPTTVGGHGISRPCWGVSVGRAFSGTRDCWSCRDSHGKGAVSHWLVRRQLLLPSLTKAS